MVGVFMGPRVKDYRAMASGIRFLEPLNRSVPVRTPSQKMRMGRDIKISLQDKMKKGWRLKHPSLPGFHVTLAKTYQFA